MRALSSKRWTGAFHGRRPVRSGGLSHHSDRGPVCVEIHRALGRAGIELSVGNAEDSYDNALAEIINRLYKAEVVHLRGPWHSFRGGRACYAGMGRLVQQSSAAGADRQHPASRSRGTIPRHAGQAGHSRVTRMKQAPVNSAPFMSPLDRGGPLARRNTYFRGAVQWAGSLRQQRQIWCYDRHSLSKGSGLRILVYPNLRSISPSRPPDRRHFCLPGKVRLMP